MSDSVINESKKVSILRKIVDQQSSDLNFEKMRLLRCRDETIELQEEIKNYRKILDQLYPEKELLESRLKYLDESIEELNFHLAETLKSRERMRNSLSWRSTAPLRWIERFIGGVLK